MSDWAAKRFWKEASVIEKDGSFAVLLDGRSVRTPAKAELLVPTAAMATAIAAEWDAQDDTVDPESMPVTRGANAAIDKVTISRDAVIDMLAEYGDSDLLCYRATSPEALVARQSAAWDPVLDWAAEVLNARLLVAQGVMHIPQQPDALAVLRKEVASFDAFALAGLHDLVSLSGSLVLALAVCKGRLSPQEAWQISRVDEHWQIEQWGEDDEATAQESTKRDAFLNAARFFEMSLTYRHS